MYVSLADLYRYAAPTIKFLADLVKSRFPASKSSSPRNPSWINGYLIVKLYLAFLRYHNFGTKLVF